MRLEKPGGHDAVLGDAIENAVGTDDRGVDRAGKDQEADHHDERFNASLTAQFGPRTFMARPPIRFWS